MFLLPFFMRRNLGTTQFVSRDKNFLTTIFVMKTEQNIQATDNHNQKYCWLRLCSARTEQYTSREECNK